MTPPEHTPPSPAASGAGCGVLAGASAVSLLFFAQGMVSPILASMTGLELSGGRWILASVGAGLLVAVITGFAAARALRQMP